MSRGMKVGLVIGVLALAAGGGIAYSMNKKKNAGTEVRMEQVSRRDLVSAVTASGKIEPQTSVDISADITGRIIRIAVEEGDRVTKGQFLIQIDPAQYQAAVSRAEGVVSSTQATLLQTRANRDQAERAWKRANELTQLGPEPHRARHGRGSPDGARRGRGDLLRRPGRSSTSRARASRRPRTTWPRPAWSRPSPAGWSGSRSRRARWRCPARSRGRPACCSPSPTSR